MGAYKLNNRAVEIVQAEVSDGQIVILDAYFIDSLLTLTESQCLKLEDRYQQQLLEDGYGQDTDRWGGNHE